MVFELLGLDITGIDSFVVGLFLVVAFYGYLVKTIFSYGFRRMAYIPSQNKSNLDNFLNHLSWAVFVSILLIDIYLIINSNKLLDSRIEDFQRLFVSLAIFIIISSFAALLCGIVVGNFIYKISPDEICIKMKNDKPLQVNEIYSDDDRYFYYIGKNGKWGLVEKEKVEKIERVEKKESTELVQNNVKTTEDNLSPIIKDDANIDNDNNNTIFLNITLIAIIISAGQIFISENQTLFKDNYPNILSEFYILSAVCFILLYIQIQSKFWRLPKNIMNISQKYFLLNLFVACIVIVISLYADSYQNSSVLGIISLKQIIFLLILSISINIGIPLTFVIVTILYTFISHSDTMIKKLKSVNSKYDFLDFKLVLNLAYIMLLLLLTGYQLLPK